MKKNMTSEHLLMLLDVLEQFLAGQMSGFGAVDVRGTPGLVGAAFGRSNVRILGLFDVFSLCCFVAHFNVDFQRFVEVMFTFCCICRLNDSLFHSMRARTHSARAMPGTK